MYQGDERDPYERRGKRGKLTGIIASLVILLILLGAVLYLLFSSEDVPDPKDIIDNYVLDQTEESSEEVVLDSPQETSVEEIPEEEVQEIVEEENETPVEEIVDVNSENADTEPISEEPLEEVVEQAETESVDESPEDLVSQETIEYPRVEFDIYRVQEGETLSSISSKFSLPEECLMSVNNLVGGNIRSGQPILVPSMPILQFVVLEDGSLSDVIERNLIENSPEEIAALNGISLDSTFKLGDILYVPYTESMREDEDWEWVMPLEGEILYSFGSNFGARVLNGVIVRGESEEEVVSPMNAEVISTGADRTLGEYITLLLDNGYELTFYGMEEIYKSVGDTLSMSESIGRIGEEAYGLLPSSVYIIMSIDGEYVDPIEHT